MARKPKKSRVVSVDFTDVEVGGGAVRIPEGDYPFKVDKADMDVSESSGEDMIVWQFVGIGGKKDKANGKRFYVYTSLAPQALWKLRGLLDALGVDAPQEPVDLDLDDMIDLEIMGVVQDDTYTRDRKEITSSKIMDWYPIDGEEDQPEEKPAKRRGRGKDEEDEEEEKPRRRRRGGDEEDEEEKPTRRGRRARDEEEDDEKPARRGRRGRDEEDVEEEEQSSSRNKKRGGAKVKFAETEVKDMDESELEDVVKKAKLDVDLDEHKTLRRKVAAVLAALEEAGQLEDAAEEEEEEKPTRRRRR